MAKKQKETGMYISKGRLFWRIQKDCLSNMVTPYVMYLFMSMLLLATQSIGTVWLRIFLGVLCILAGAAFNAHLTYTYGSSQYDFYLTGCIHRRNIENGIESGGDHHLEREYAPWKGFYIGFLVGLPVVLFAGLACIPGAMNGVGKFMLVMFAGYALVPVSWIFSFEGGFPSTYYAYSMFMVLLPIIVSGVFYLLGAYVEKRRKQAQAERDEAVRKLQEEQKYAREHRVQTEEQKRKTLQSKKKK